MNPFNYKTIKQTAVAGALISQAMVGLAQAENLPTLIVTAGRIAENPANISANVSVITRADIETSQAVSVADLLRTQVGIDVAANGGLGTQTSVYLRGGNSGHVLVLIDGVRVGSVTTGSFNWADLSTADIERIEIVRGAQSSLYGADAMAGVVQIFTRQGKKGVQTQVSAELGTYGTKSFGASVQGGTSGVTYAVSANSLSSDGFSVATSGSEADAYQRTTLSGRVGFQIGQGDIELMLRSAKGEVDLDGFKWKVGPVDALNYKSVSQQDVRSLKVSYPFFDNMESTLQLSQSVDDVQSTDPVTSWNNADFKTTIDQLTWQNHVDLDATSILFGVDAHRGSGKSISAGLDKVVTQQAGFASFSHAFAVADLNGSLRYDDNSVSDNQTTYKVGGVFHITDTLHIAANFGTGFKAPTINDLYFPNDGFGTQGNINLRPETSSGWDAGLSYAVQSASLDAGFNATWFKQTYQDLIVWAMDPVTFAFSPMNVGAATSQGLELTAYVAGRFGFVRGNWTKLDAKDDTTGLLLARRAATSGHLVLGTDVAGLHAELQWNTVGKRFSDVKNKVKLDAYETIDLRLNYAVTDTWKVNVRAENLQDTIYEEVSGYAVAGRAIYGGVSAAF